MKWKTLMLPTPETVERGNEERAGELIQYKIFAFFPTKCSDGLTRWLETVLVTCVWGKIYYGIRGCYRWGWVEKSIERAQ